MSSYSSVIAAAINRDDPATLALVEELMRTDLTALDHLSAAQFDALARQSAKDAWMLYDSGQLVMYCDALMLDVPSWAV